jgi:endonuclease/exonuclease/phosphatase (EEP) superfamily protein YafD
LTGYGLAALLLILCALRLWDPDRYYLEIAVESVLPWLLLLAIPLLIVALAMHKQAMAALAVIPFVVGAVWEAPDLWPFSTAPAARGTARIRLFDANVAQNNFDLRSIAKEIAAEQPDLIALEELTPAGLSSLSRTGVLHGYRWQIIRSATGARGMALWSRWPANSLHAWMNLNGQYEIDGWIRPPGARSVRVNVIHVYAPVGSDQPTLWREQLDAVKSHLQAERGPLIVAGDFNATADVKPFNAILGLHLSDTAVQSGQGWRMTWPRDQSWVIPYLRIDHVLISNGLTVTSFHLGNGHGSDHHPLVVTLAFAR